MKKVILLSMAFCLFLFGCKPEIEPETENDGVYNPSKKISRIYEQSQGESKTLREEWTWNNDLLQKVDYYYSNHFSHTENYMYDEKNRVIKVENDAFGYNYAISYDEGSYHTVECYIKDQLFSSVEFQYENKKISKLTITQYFNEEDMYITNGFMNMIVPKEVIENAKSLCSKHAKGDTYPKTTTINFTYIGNNVSKYETIADGNVETYTFEDYDDNFNPFYRSFPEEFNAYSENNPRKSIEAHYRTIEYNYVYEDNYPIEIEMIITRHGDTYKHITYYEYLK